MKVGHKTDRGSLLMTISCLAPFLTIVSLGLIVAAHPLSGDGTSSESSASKVIGEKEFAGACQKLVEDWAKIRPRPGVVLGKMNWALLRTELDLMTAGRFWEDSADTSGSESKTTAGGPLRAILHFNRQLAENGIKLLVVPVPVRPLIYPESVVGYEGSRPVKNMRVDYRSLAEFYEILKRNDCAVVDLTEALFKERWGALGPVFCPASSHWTSSGAYVAGLEIAAVIKRETWYSEVLRTEFKSRWVEREETGELVERLEKGYPNISVRATMVQGRVITPDSSVPGASLERRNPGSPVVLMGDSFTENKFAIKTGVAHQLAFELGFPVDTITNRGGGATAVRMDFIREARRSSDYLDSVKLVVWCFSSRVLAVEHRRWALTPINGPDTEPS